MDKCGWEGLFAAIFYGVCSAGMAFANKAVISSFEFDFPFLILVLQMLVSIAVVQMVVLTGTATAPPYTFERGKSFFLPALCSALHSCLSLVALKGMNIPMYGALKRCTPLVNLILSVLVLKKSHPPALVVWSIGFITFGCLVAGFGDLSFNGTAYAVGTASVVVQGLYQTLIQKAYEKHASVFEIFQLNSYNCLPILVIGSVLWGEPQRLLNYSYLANPGFLACLFTVVFLGTVLNYSLFLSTSLNSALTTSIVGVFKSVVQTAIGFFTFGGVPFNPINLTGIVLNTCGGGLYAYAKISPANQRVHAELNGIEINGKTDVHIQKI